MSEENDDDTSEIPLSPLSNTNTNVSGSGRGQQQTDETTNNDRASNDSELDDLLDELEESNRSETEVAVESLKDSANKLSMALRNVGSDIDSKFNISQQARSVDSQLGVSRTLSSATGSIVNFLNQLKIDEKARGILNQDSVRNISHSVDESLEKTGVKDAVIRGVHEVKALDDQHKISVKAISAFSSGIDWVANTLQASSDTERMLQKQKRDHEDQP